MRYLKLGLVLGLLFVVVPNVGAFVNPPILVPDQPSEADTVAIVLTSGHCDDLFPADSEIFRVGSSIRVVVPGQRSTLVCIVPPTEDTVIIGHLPAGSYTLQVDYSHYSPGDPGNVTVETIGIIDFAVAPAPVGVAATPVPAFGLIGMIILGPILLAVASLGLRHRAGRPA